LDIFAPSWGAVDPDARELFGGKVVNMHIGVPREEIHSRLAEFDFGVFPSMWDEPFGMAQVELMAAGLPVVSSLRGGSAEVYDGSNLIPFSWDDQGSLVKAVSLLNQNDMKLGATVGGSASKSVRSKFSSDSYLIQLEGILEGSLIP